MKRTIIILSVALFVVAAALTTGFALHLRQNVCTADEYRAATSPILARWRNAELAAKNDPNNLAEHIAAMKLAQLDFSSVDYPPCARNIHREMSASLDSYIAGYELMRDGAARASIDEKLRQGDQHLSTAANMLTELD